MALLFDTSAVISLVERGSVDATDLIRRAGERPHVSFATLVTADDVQARRASGFVDVSLIA